MELKNVKHKDRLIRVLKIEIAECLKRIEKYEQYAIEGGCSYDSLIHPERQAIEDYDQMIKYLELKQEISK